MAKQAMVASPGVSGRRGHSMDARIRNQGSAHVEGVAPAKLNLFLEVVGKRSDGYHDLATVFHEIDLVDELRVELRPEQHADSIALSGRPIDGACGDNLVLAAARSFRTLVAAAPPIHVDLVKNIPPGSGMGGGSSDAAFVLEALRRLVAPRRPVAGLQAAARAIGADVAFFLAGGSAIGTGRGDELTPIEVPKPARFLLVTPRFALSTAKVYGHADLKGARVAVSSFVDRWVRRGDGTAITGCFNRLERAAALVEPRLEHLLAGLRESTRSPWGMTGSGSACFVPMSSADDAEELAQRVTSDGKLDIPVGEVRTVASFDRHRESR